MNRMATRRGRSITSLVAAPKLEPAACAATGRAAGKHAAVTATDANNQRIENFAVIPTLGWIMSETGSLLACEPGLTGKR